ncbi:class I SAM-dependent methyltransferase [Paenibacillus sp. 1001270B_150601_E10]|uniref:class I SAM-dependent methyltransferase n=1 Tax=Paenibacillus sp. 1001270B_150601_E10 TaxID=2787079 RepID=UPI00189FE945|nr:class I SAM-dependent methyltransferase [Paenibacillus sp. 1001270B_150601_E10]
MERITKIREEEKKYHDNCYKNSLLFEPGSWLHKPVKTVMDLLDEYNDCEYLSVLDLGSGVGRNSIPIAQSLKQRDGRVVCVDLLESAISNLREYSKQYEVEHLLELKLSDIEKFTIMEKEYDLIISVSALEHVRSEDILLKKLAEMINGTKQFGSHCIVMSSNIREEVLDTGEALDPMFELNISTPKLMELLDHLYDSWEVKTRLVKKLEFVIDRDGRDVKLSSDCITFVARRIV